MKTAWLRPMLRSVGGQIGSRASGRFRRERTWTREHGAVFSARQRPAEYTGVKPGHAIDRRVHLFSAPHCGRGSD